MDPVTRAGMLPVVDGVDFVNRAVSSPSNRSRIVAEAGSAPPEEAGISSQTKRELVEQAGDSIQNAKLDPYVFSPPGMDL